MKRKERLELEATALQRVVDCIEKAQEIWDGLEDLDYTETLFTLRGRSAAQARWGMRGDEKHFQMKINMEAYALDPQDMITNTIPHETAHLVQFALDWDVGHGHEWHSACIALGGDGRQFHSMKLTPARKSKRFLYVNDDGAEIHLKQGRHSNLKLGKAHYYATSTGNRWYKHHYVSEVIVNPHTGRIEVESDE